MLNVLVVEDDDEIATLHAHFMSKDPRFKVLSIAATLAQARDIVNAVPIDLIIVDNYLPDGLGVDFVLELLHKPKRPECILVTAANDASTVQKALRFGAFDYLVKPLDYRRLAASLERFWTMEQQLHGDKSLAQKEVDQLFSLGRPSMKSPSSTDLYTLKQIVAQFTNTNVEQTVSSIAQSFGMSKSTARRYLDKAVEEGELIAFLEHGKVGRPTRIYRRPSIHEV